MRVSLKIWLPRWSKLNAVIDHQSRQTIAVIGGGSFGTVIANLAAHNGHQVRLWMRSEEQCQEICEHNTNSRYLPKYPLNPSLEATTDLTDAVSGATILMFAVPSKAVRSVAKDVASVIGNKRLAAVSLTKGVEPSSFNLMSEVLHEELPECDIAVISGPNLAKEIAQGTPSATVVASRQRPLREALQNILRSDTFRLYTNPDVYGVELAGALKNIYAIVSGMAESLGMGANTRAMIMTRSLAEMSRFAERLGADPLTFLGLAGVGDLIVTCTSPLSRNYRVGQAIGQGFSLKQAVKQLGEVAEGVNTLHMVYEKANEMQVEMPLVQGLHAILFEGADVDHLAYRLMIGTDACDVEFMTHR